VISVIVPSNRIGGLDILFAALAAQTYRDFELVLVDNIHKHRSEYVAHHAQGCGFPVTHIPPRDNSFPDIAYCRTMNTGVAHARGDTLVYFCDYSWLHPTCLETHARLQAEHRGPVTLDYRYVDLPPLKPGLPNYREKTSPTDANIDPFTDEVNANADRYADDLRSGRLDAFLWSILAEPLTEEAVLAANVEHTHRPSGADLATDWNWCSFKNESFPTDLVLEMNGHDEEYAARTAGRTPSSPTGSGGKGFAGTPDSKTKGSCPS
jgi:glycosyltransferase involved in cell wall biosynthesis